MGFCGVFFKVVGEECRFFLDVEGGLIEGDGVVDAEFVDERDNGGQFGGGDGAGLMREFVKGELTACADVGESFRTLGQVVLSPGVEGGGEGEVFEPGEGASSAEFHKFDDVISIGGFKGVVLFSSADEGEGHGAGFGGTRGFMNHFGEAESFCLCVTESLNGEEGEEKENPFIHR